MKHGPTNTRVLRDLKTSLHLSDLQREIVIGTILGDGCLITSRSGRAARLQVRHQLKHSAYVDWKYQYFLEWVTTAPRFDRFNNSVVFRTVSHPDLMDIKRLFYTGVTKIVPSNIDKILKTPLSLAIWFMDDGTYYRDALYYKLCSYGFGEDGNILLRNCLDKNFHVQTKICNDGKGYYLSIPFYGAVRLYELVKPHVVPCMLYKLSNADRYLINVDPVETDPQVRLTSERKVSTSL
ncbi:hypothetical protein HYZ70_03955 [Candidatus Curtissbacteria bacterium]|nr:hypothetical protein [Candidatus Curtissbacteria bacterium]